MYVVEKLDWRGLSVAQGGGGKEVVGSSGFWSRRRCRAVVSVSELRKIKGEAQKRKKKKRQVRRAKMGEIKAEAKANSSAAADSHCVPFSVCFR